MNAMAAALDDDISLTKRERDILAAFLRVWRQRKRARRARRQKAQREAMDRAKAALDAERLDDELDRLGRGVGPTPETARRLQADVLVRLHGDGKIGAAEKQAAGDIRDALAAFERALFPARKLDLAGVRVKGTWRGLVGLERMKPWEQALWRRYAAWARQVGDRPFQGVPATRLEIILDVIVDNLGPSQVERRHGISRGMGKVTKTVRDGLRLYAEMHGISTRRRRAS